MQNQTCFAKGYEKAPSPRCVCTISLSLSVCLSVTVCLSVSVCHTRTCMHEQKNNNIGYPNSNAIARYPSHKTYCWNRLSHNVGIRNPKNDHIVSSSRKTSFKSGGTNFTIAGKATYIHGQIRKTV